MFHVDPKGDTQGNQYTSDDVIVTYEGNLGIGLIPPALSDTKLIVTDGGTPASPKSPLRIIDGNRQAEGRALTSVNTGGMGTWADLPAGFSLGEAYEPIGVPGGLVIKTGTNTGNRTQYTPLGFYFYANAVGFYAFEIRWWARVQDATLSATNLYQNFRLIRNNSAIDTFEAYTNTIGGSQDICTISFTMYGQATAVNDMFEVEARVATPLVTENNSSTLWTRSWVKIVRMY